MKIIFLILVALWMFAVGVWTYMITNKTSRENLDFLFPLIAILLLNVLIVVCSYFL